MLNLLPPERIAALSIFADDPHQSNVAEKARAVQGRVAGNVEQVIASRPDLVIVASYSKVEFLEAIRRAGIPVLELEHFDNWKQIEKNVEIIGAAVGEKVKSEALIASARAKMDKVKTAIDDLPRPAVLYFASGWTTGSGTSIDEMIQLAGGKNYAALQGLKWHSALPMERILVWRPDMILLEGASDGNLAGDFSHEYPLLASHPTVKAGRVLALPTARLTTVSQYFADGVEDLARLLHPDAFKQPAPAPETDGPPS